MTWLPDPEVTIGGVDVTDVTVESVRVTRGRDRVYASAQAGYVSCQLTAGADFVPPQVASELTVSVAAGFEVDATGGDEVFDASTPDGEYQVHRFTSVGTATFTLNEPAFVEVLIVGGGGAGQRTTLFGTLDGGGGGGGGISIRSLFLEPDTYEVVVGGGGKSQTADTVPEPGQPSSFDGIIVPGGAGGRGSDGASGGGGSFSAAGTFIAGGSGEEPFGNDGGDAAGTDGVEVNGGGGGGFTGAGSDATTSAAGDGGRGIVLAFDGLARDYASGGGGGRRVFDATDGVGGAPGGASGGFGGYRRVVEPAGAIGPIPVFKNGADAPPNGGGGGGGLNFLGFGSPFPGENAGDGGSGVVIVRIPRRLRLFTGRVSDVSVLPVRTQDGLLFQYGITAVGPLATLSRRRVFSTGRAAEIDGDRISAVLSDSFGTTWEEYPDQEWDEVPAGVSWLGIDPEFQLSLVDPGTFLVSALDPQDAGYASLAVLNQTAESGLGVMVETRGGSLGYQDRNRRVRELDFGETVEFSFDSVAVNSVDATVTLGDVVNVAEVEYAGGVVVRSDTDSIRDFGRLERDFSTVLVEEADAVTFAEQVSTAQAEPRFRLQRVTLNLRGVGEVLRTRLLNVELGAVVRVGDVPGVFGSGDFFGFVEGVEVSVGEFAGEVSLLVSSARFSVPGFVPPV